MEADAAVREDRVVGAVGALAADSDADAVEGRAFAAEALEDPQARSVAAARRDVDDLRCAREGLGGREPRVTLGTSSGRT